MERDVADRTGLRKGYTTGACAAAASKAAVSMLVGGRKIEEVSIRLPQGQRVSFRLVNQRLDSVSAECGVVKDAGDDPDVTHSATIMASAEWRPDGLSVQGGAGVGVVTKPGLQVPVGRPAINPVPMQMIKEAVREVTDRGVGITISVPGGEELAQRTFNYRLGIVGGISIIGTTGVVEPKSTEALKVSLLCALDVARARGHDSLVMVPGKIGERGIRKILRLEEDRLVQVGNYAGFMLEAARERDFRSILLAGHPGKLLKLIRGDFETHSARSAGAVPLLMEAMRKHQGELAEQERYGALNTVEGFIQLLPRNVSTDLFGRLAEEVQEAAEKYVRGGMGIGVILISMDGAMVGESTGARPWREGP